MFCKIHVRGDNRQCRAYNLFKGIIAVATAPAGSTPSAIGSTIDLSQGQTINPVYQYEIVTDVISNAEAGAWEVSPINQATGSGDTYTENQNLVIRRPTGKPDNPYMHFVGYHGNGGNHWVPASVLGPDDLAYTSPVMSPTNWMNHDYVGCGSPGIRATGTYADVTAIDSDKIYYVAANEEFIHIHQADSYDFIHLGLRTNMSWEDSFSDNPYWVQLDADYHEFYWTVMRHHNIDNQTYSGLVNYQGIWFNNLFSNDQTRVIYGWNSKDRNEKDVPQVQEFTLSQQRHATYRLYYPNNSDLSVATGFSNASYYNLSGTVSSRLAQPIMTAGNDHFGLTSDETSGAIVPGAQPISIRSTYGYNNGGVMKSILQGGQFANTTDRDAYFTEETTVNIDGTDYIGLLHAGGLQVIYVKKA